MGRRKTKNTDAKLKKNLLNAINLAQSPGACLYVKDDKPCCVIGQLAMIEGLTIETIAKWDKANVDNRGNIQSEAVKALIEKKIRGSNVLKKYDQELLFLVQDTWDNAKSAHSDFTEDDIRQLAREAVESHYARITNS